MLQVANGQTNGSNQLYSPFQVRYSLNIVTHFSD